MIDQITINKVRDAAQILDVVSEYVTLRRRGQNYLGLCPFHADKTPSFSVSPSKNFCKCFACGEGGDPVHFLMKHEQISYMEAIRMLAKRYGIEIKERELTDEERAAQNDREAMLRLNEYAMKVFEDDLYNTAEGKNVGLTYFYERGLQDETIRRYNLGYAIDNKYSFAKKALDKGYSRDYLTDPAGDRKVGVGLCYGEDPSKLPVCRFAGRVIFPFHSLSGKPIAFSGRILQRVDHAFKKYINSPESIIYHKSNFLYGIFQAKGEISRRNKCYIVEGNVDVLSMSQAGIQNVVASAGTALTTSQIRMIKRFSPNVTLMFDGDRAGIAASLKTIDLLLLEGMNVKLLLLPDGHDPDSFCRQHTSEEVAAFFASHEQDFISYKTQMLLQDAASDPQKKAAALQNIIASIALIEDTISSSLYIRNTAQMLNIEERALIESVNEQRKSNYAAELRNMEFERRRAEYQAQHSAEAQGTDNGEIVATADGAATAAGSSPANAIQAPPTMPQPQQPVVSQQPPHLPRGPKIETEDQRLRSELRKCEQNIVRHIVRSGGQSFNLSWTDEDGNPQVEAWRVIDYIGYDLYQDQIVLQTPIYDRMYRMAIDATADPNAVFDSVRFFTGIDDNDIMLEVNDLLEDRYDALGIASNNEDLDILIPRALLELKDVLLRMEIANLNQQLRMPGTDTLEVMRQLTLKAETKKAIQKQLGERIITG